LRGLYTELLEDDRFELYMAAADVEHLRSTFYNTDRVIFLPYTSHSKYYRLAIDIPRLIRRYKIDVAHYQYTSPLYKNTREIVTIHDILFNDFPEQFPWTYRMSKDFLFKRSARRADLVTTVSQYSYEAIVRHYNISRTKMRVVPNGVSQDFFNDDVIGNLPDVQRRYGLGNYILYVSRVEPRKNHLALVRAYVESKLGERGIKLVLIGRTDIIVKELEEYIASLSAELQAQIVRLKNIDLPSLISFYKHASLSVYPSVAEGFGIPPLEAAAVATKVLCSNATAMSDFRFFGNDLFDPRDIPGLAQKMQEAFASDDMARREEIAQVVRNTYSWKNIASDFAGHVVTLFR